MGKFVAILCLALPLWAAETNLNENKLSHESEAGVVLASGNSDTQTFNLKQNTAYAWTGNTLRFTASYLLGKTSGVETAKKWDLGLRYERAVYENLSAFLGYALDSAPFAGTNFRHTVDLGAKYGFLKSDSSEIVGELGYHLTAETFTADNGLTNSSDLTNHMTRLYGEWKENWNKSVSSKLGAEYLQSLSNTADYRFNLEPSLSVLLNEVFSVKLAYLITFRSVPAVAGKKTTDTLFTTSLVAKL